MTEQAIKDLRKGETVQLRISKLIIVSMTPSLTLGYLANVC